MPHAEEKVHPPQVPLDPRGGCSTSGTCECAQVGVRYIGISCCGKIKAVVSDWLIISVPTSFEGAVCDGLIISVSTSIEGAPYNHLRQTWSLNSMPFSATNGLALLPWLVASSHLMLMLLMHSSSNYWPRNASPWWWGSWIVLWTTWNVFLVWCAESIELNIQFTMHCSYTMDV